MQNLRPHLGEMGRMFPPDPWLIPVFLCLRSSVLEGACCPALHLCPLALAATPLPSAELCSAKSQPPGVASLLLIWVPIRQTCGDLLKFFRFLGSSDISPCDCSSRKSGQAEAAPFLMQAFLWVWAGPHVSVVRIGIGRLELALSFSF